MINQMVKRSEVSAKATRHWLSTAETIRVLREADAVAHETVRATALLRGEEIYSSHLTSWVSKPIADQSDQIGSIGSAH